MAVPLLCELHGELLRILCDEAHAQGLSVAARRSLLPNQLRKKVMLVDSAFSVMRHLTRPWCHESVLEVRAAISATRVKRCSREQDRQAMGHGKTTRETAKLGAAP